MTCPAPGVDALDVANFLGQGDNEEVVSLAWEHLPAITAMAYAYTRGGGFALDEYGCMAANHDVAQVVKTATARLVANPEQLRYQAGSIQINDSFRGWTLAETFVLNRYRRRAM